MKNTLEKKYFYYSAKAWQLMSLALFFVTLRMICIEMSAVVIGNTVAIFAFASGIMLPLLSASALCPPENNKKNNGGNSRVYTFSMALFIMTIMFSGIMLSNIGFVVQSYKQSALGWAVALFILFLVESTLIRRWKRRYGQELKNA